MDVSFERIVVIGSSCAGKSTFAAALARELGCTAVELDHLYWGPNWTAKPLQEFRQLTEQAVAPACWVVSGNYGMVRDVVWSRATLVIWLNYSFATVLGRALRRTVRRMVTREQLWHGNYESFRRSFLSRDSILVWIVTTFQQRRREFQQLRTGAAFPHLKWIEFRRPREARRYRARLAARGRTVEACPELVEDPKEH